MYFSRQAETEVIATHLRRNGRAVFVRDGAIVLAVGSEQSVLIKLAHVPVLAGNVNAVQLDSVLAAVAAAWALHITQVLIRAGLSTFEVNAANAKDIA